MYNASNRPGETQTEYRFYGPLTDLKAVNLSSFWIKVQSNMSSYLTTGQKFNMSVKILHMEGKDGNNKDVVLGNLGQCCSLQIADEKGMMDTNTAKLFIVNSLISYYSRTCIKRSPSGNG